MSDYTKFKEVQKFNKLNCDKKCPECGGNLQPQHFGYSCYGCGLMLTRDLKHATIDDLI